MGRLIDIDKARKEYSNLTDLTMSDTTLLLTLFGVLDNAPTIEAIPKDQYEARLKADMVTMLTEIQISLEENNPFINEDEPMYGWLYAGYHRAIENIQEKINTMKGECDEGDLSDKGV